MRTVVLDTNALMMPVELDVRLFEELDRVLDATSGGVGDRTETAADENAVTDNGATETGATETADGEDPSADEAIPTIGAEGGLELVVPQATIEELRKLSDSGGEEGIAASVGEDLATDRCVPVDTDASYADDAVVELAREGVADYVVTNDQPLRDRVLDAGVPVLSLRGTDKLAVTEP